MENKKQAWQMRECSNGGVIVSFGDSDQQVQIIDKKKAKLIVAAPVLLEALKYAKRFIDPKDVDMDFINNAIKQAE